MISTTTGATLFARTYDRVQHWVHALPIHPSSPLLLALASLLFLTSCDPTDIQGPDTTNQVTAIPCKDGLVNNIFPCNKVEMLSFVTLTDMGETDVQANDIWGWVDPQTEKEYALVGLTNGVAIYDITKGDEPIYVGKLPEADAPTAKMGPLNSVWSANDTSPVNGSSSAKGTSPVNNTPFQPIFSYHDDSDTSGKGASAWRDIKTYRNTMYVVTDVNDDRGMQVFDLERLRTVDSNAMPVTFDHDYLYTEIGNAHNLHINEESGFAYVVGALSGTQCAQNGQLHIVDLSNRLFPVFAGCHLEPAAGQYIKAGYIHDTQCVIYKGPDADYTGREICFSSSERAFLISDVTDKQNPSTVSLLKYQGNQYAHQGWLTEDQSHFYLNDELDELRNGHNTRTYILNVSDLDNPSLKEYYQHETTSIDHNLYIKGNTMYQANYMAGLRVLDITNPTGWGTKEIGFFDTTPTRTEKRFEGTWSVYPWFENNKIILSDIYQGFFVLQFKPE